MFRRLLLLNLGLMLSGALHARAAAPALESYASVTVAPVKTSIYIGSVTLASPPYLRKAGVYTTSYTAKVFPYFFYSEHGTISIAVSDDQLRQLGRGETITFTGQGLSSDGEPRHIEGKVTPVDAATGKIKVRVFVSKRIQLIFNTTYRFGGS
jgi:hypothetical protein